MISIALVFMLPVKCDFDPFLQQCFIINYDSTQTEREAKKRMSSPLLSISRSHTQTHIRRLGALCFTLIPDEKCDGYEKRAIIHHSFHCVKHNPSKQKTHPRYEILKLRDNKYQTDKRTWKKNLYKKQQNHLFKNDVCTVCDK